MNMDFVHFYCYLPGVVVGDSVATVELDPTKINSSCQY